MTKRSKPRTTKPAVTTTTQSPTEYAIAHLYERMRAIAEGRAEKTKHDDESRVAHLARQIDALEEGKRKRERDERKHAASHYTLASVVAWLRTQPADERARVVRELQSLDKRGGVLG